MVASAISRAAQLDTEIYFNILMTVLFSGLYVLLAVSDRVGSFAVLLALAVLVSLVCAWVGLEIGARLSKRAQGR
jgi:hypothetical protein